MTGAETLPVGNFPRKQTKKTRNYYYFPQEGLIGRETLL